MKLLVSVCNKLKNPNLALPGVFLFECDSTRQDVKPVIVKHPEIESAHGITGLAHYRDGILAIVQDEKVSKMVFLGRDYRVRHLWTLAHVSDGHSIAIKDDVAYIASTGNDAVVAFAPERGESFHWRENEGNTDTLHVNSVTWHRGDLYITAFGRKKGELWKTADEGYLQNLRTGQIAAQPLYHPHSALATDEGIYYCESSSMFLGRDDGTRLAVRKGYVRGLVVTNTHLFVGTSKGRMKSKSTGQVIDNPSGPGVQAGMCSVLIFQRHSSGFDKSELVGKISLETLGDEVYDILPS